MTLEKENNDGHMTRLDMSNILKIMQDEKNPDVQKMLNNHKKQVWVFTHGEKRKTLELGQNPECVRNDKSGNFFIFFLLY